MVSICCWHVTMSAPGATGQESIAWQQLPDHKIRRDHDLDAVRLRVVSQVLLGLTFSHTACQTWWLMLAGHYCVGASLEILMAWHDMLLMVIKIGGLQPLNDLVCNNQK